jgi:hypothetical protein
MAFFAPYFFPRLSGPESFGQDIIEQDQVIVAGPSQEGTRSPSLAVSTLKRRASKLGARIRRSLVHRR